MQKERKQRTAASDAARRARTRRRWRPSSPAKIAANRLNARRSCGPRSAAGKQHASRNAVQHALTTIGRRNPECLPEIERMAKAYCNGNPDPLLYEQAMIVAENDYILRCVRSERLASIERMRDPNAIPFAKSGHALARAKQRFRQAEFAYWRLLAAKRNNTTAARCTSPLTAPNPTTQAPTSDAATRGAAGNVSAGWTGPASKSKVDPARSPPSTAASSSASPSNASNSESPSPPQSVALRDEFEAMRLAMPDFSRLERYERRAASRRKRAIREFMEIKSRRND
jgi:hypothetical protein